MKNIDLENKCGSCLHFKPIDGTCNGACLRNKYGEDVVHDPNQPYWVVARSRIKCKDYNLRMTNADRIRAMTDEELATELLPMFEELCEDGIPSPEYMRFWLKQPVGGNEHD